jgi:hypothetical protein
VSRRRSFSIEIPTITVDLHCVHPLLQIPHIASTRRPPTTPDPPASIVADSCEKVTALSTAYPSGSTFSELHLTPVIISRLEFTFMHRGPTSRRGVVSSVSETHTDARPKSRAPLTRISNNLRVRPAGTDPTLKPVAARPVVTVEPPRPSVFSHREVPLGDREDPQDVVEFEHIIYRSLRGKESAARPLRFAQTEITLRDRSLLIDALDRFHYKLGLTTNALYRFIGILDRYFAVASVAQAKLRVVGCAALLIASKIEEIFPVQSRDLIKLSEHSFTQSELFGAEIEIINAIQFETTFPTPLFFLTQFMRIHEQTKDGSLLARYILEICQTHDFFFGVSSSLLASVAIMVTRILTGEEHWPVELAGYTMYKQEQLEPYATAVRAMLLDRDREESRFIRRKYSSEPFRSVALVKIPPEWR